MGNAEDFVLKNSSMETFLEMNNKLIILIDTRPEHIWRVSSPRTQHFESGKVLTVRGVDLKLSEISPMKKLLLTTRIESLESKLQHLIHCTGNPKVQIQNENVSEDYKYLFSNGSVIEFYNVEVDCTDGGHPCSFIDKEDNDPM